MIDIIVAGDFCPRDRVENLIEKQLNSDIFKDIAQVTSSADYAIVNLEAPIVLENRQAITKVGPNLKCTEKACESLKYLGFQLATLANNHFRDYGNEGCLDTISTLTKHNIAYVGGGANLEEASKTHYVEIKGKKFAVINCCEHEFSIATENQAGSNPINPIQQYYAIREAKKESDYVIVIVHGGVEHCQLPTPRMQEIYRFFIEAGADTVINHHQHCYSGYEVYKNKPIIYGLGNFCFDWPDKKSGIWTEGYLAKISFDEAKISIQTIPYIQCGGEPTVRLMNDGEKETFNKKIAGLNTIIADANKLKQEYEHYINSHNNKKYQFLISPYLGKLKRSLFLRGILPMKTNKSKLLSLYNVLTCESHNDRFLHEVETLISKEK